MDTLRADFLFGLRALRRTPAFTAVAVLTLAIGIGATSAIFSIVNGTMLYGLPWSEPESIVSFRLMHKREGEARAMTLAQYRDFGAQAKSFEGLLATFFDQAYLTDREEARMVYAPKVTVGSLGLMGVEPLLGRGFTEAEGHRGFLAMLKKGHKFTAVVAANDLLALGCYDALQELGFQCPADMSVTGFNDMPFVDRLTPPLTSLHIPHDEIGIQAAELLVERMENPKSSVRTVNLLPQLIVRGSTAAPNNKRA